jgi:arylsulfatase A-like enzyme
MIANRDWKLALNVEREVYLLFDLRRDPLETRNLAGLPEYDDVERTLRQQLEDSDRHAVPKESSPAPGQALRATDEP